MSRSSSSGKAARLRRQAPTNRFLLSSAVVFGALVLFAWIGGGIDVQGFFAGNRGENLERFFRREAMPFPLREGGFSWSGLAHWVSDQWSRGGGSATVMTFWIAIASIVMAGAGALLIAPCTAGTVCTQEPFLSESVSRGGIWPWLSRGARLICILARALPEYVLAFFLVGILPQGAWPAVLALALHNGGILGRLYGDTLENLERRPLRALRVLGGSRGQITTLAAIPLATPRFLLYFFYRFETCVREATVLGMLGIVSLGYKISEARSRQFYDELILLVGFGVLLVLLADLASHMARGWLRREDPR